MSRLPHVLFALFVCLCLAALVWPVYSWAGERIEPRIFGLPFAFTWNILWVALSFLALFTYDRVMEGRRS